MGWIQRIMATAAAVAVTSVATAAEDSVEKYIADVAVVTAGVAICSQFEINPATMLVYGLAFDIKPEMIKEGPLRDVFMTAFGSAKTLFAAQSVDMVCRAIDVLYGPTGEARRHLVMPAGQP